MVCQGGTGDSHRRDDDNPLPLPTDIMFELQSWQRPAPCVRAVRIGRVPSRGSSPGSPHFLPMSEARSQDRPRTTITCKIVPRIAPWIIAWILPWITPWIVPRIVPGSIVTIDINLLWRHGDEGEAGGIGEAYLAHVRWMHIHDVFENLHAAAY